MSNINLRYQEYRLALLFFRASALLASNYQLPKSDIPYLIRWLFDYCYYRYLTFDITIASTKRNKASVKSKKAKENMIAYLQRRSDNTAFDYCNKIFGVDNWTYVLPRDYYLNYD